MPNSNKRTKLAIYICGIFFIITAITVIYILSIDDMINGVNVSGISIEGMNKEEAKKHLMDQLHNKLKDRYIKLKYKEDEYVHDYEKLGINYDYDKTVEKIYQDIDTKTNINKIKTFLTGLINERDYDMEYTYDISRLEEFVKSMEKDINSEAQNASVKIDNDRIDIVPEIIGKKVDSNSLKEILISSIGKDSIIDIPVIEESPTIVEKDIETIDSVLGSFVTRYNTSKKNRVNNIVQATNTINNKILMPNEKFSFNKATGVRNSDNGYKKAPVIINGELVPEVGGGVCQVSSTLYNAVLLSGLDILERHNHSLPLSYIGKGRDATVVYDVLDFKFKNSLPEAIYIEAISEKGKMEINIYGNEKLKKDIEIVPSVVQSIKPKQEVVVDPNMKAGERKVIQKGRWGYKVNTYKIIKQGKDILSKELISKDVYKGRKEVIKVGKEQE